MSGSEGELDLEKAQLDPDSEFSSPEELRDHRGLMREQMIEILRRWALDASELAVAEEEGMIGGESSRLAQVLFVLDTLTSGYDVEHSPPTKQEGV